MSRVVFRVRRGFKYGGVQYKTGDEFVPQGHRTDDTLIQRFCWTKQEPEKPTEEGDDAAKKNSPRGAH